MDGTLPVHIRVAPAAVITRIVGGDFDGLIADGCAPRHVDGDLGLWVRDDPVELIDLPEEAWRYAEVIIDPARPGWWAVNVPLWTEEEGRSDLELEATVVERDGRVRVEVDNIHVP